MSRQTHNKKWNNIMNKQIRRNKATRQIREIFEQSLNLYEEPVREIKKLSEVTFWDDECIHPTDDITIKVFYEYISLINMLLVD